MKHEQVEKLLKKLVVRLVTFPYPQICKHLVVLDVLSILEELGYNVGEELVEAVSKADDLLALQLLN